jgi:AcrR family transcriptional regulator
VRGRIAGTLAAVVGATSTPEGRRRRSDAERNIRAIVDAASRLLADQPHASMQEIAEGAGLHRATVHRHFATRDDLLMAVREQALDDFTALLNDPELTGMEPARAMREVTRRSLELGDSNRVYRLTASFDDASDERAELMARPTTALIRRAQAAGVVRTDLPPELVAMAWGGLVLVVLPRIADGMPLESAADFVLAMVATPAG